ncbi:MAG: hypothetical protein E6G15_11110 [Actinobacteria bacterium]|nr:MAG: hypothetical protein E6G15_11110 [Actinomycetota bacterium]
MPVLMNGFGAPAGGGLRPSRSAGMNWSLVGLKNDGSRKVMNVAGLPASMAARSKANGSGPRNAVPPELNTFMPM